VTHFIRRIYGGGLRPNDPRRLLIEAMVAAMRADGTIDPREMQVLEDNVADHDLFGGLDQEAAKVLIEMANEALDLAGSSVRRVDAIARGLPARTHRLAAYAVACEVCFADSQIAAPEQEFLDALRQALLLDDEEAEIIAEAARGRMGMAVVDRMTREIAALVPRFVDCMALMAAADGVVHAEERQAIRDVLRGMGDMSTVGDDQLDELIEQSFARIGEGSVVLQIEAMATEIRGSADRYWATVYIMVVALVEGWNSVRQVRVISAVKDSFGMTHDQMTRAMENAKLFAAKRTTPL
jgi:uncharacterized membrane protein YebE (DUF533 family)